MTVTAELHDGTTLEFPDGTDPAVVQATVKKVLSSRSGQAPQPAQQPQPEQPTGPSAALQVAVPAIPLGDAALSLATGAIAAPVAGFAGMAQGVKNLVSPGMEAGDRVRQVQEAMTYQPRSSGGQKMVEAVSYPFEKLAQGADYVGGAVTDATGSAALGAGINTAIQAVPMLLGKVAGPKARRAAALERERVDIAAKLNLPRDKVIAQSREAGYVLPPAEANPTLLNRVLEGFSGQAKVQQLASAKNQPVTNAIVRKGLGIAEDTPITIEVLEGVRKNAGQAYEQVRSLGDIKTDATYKQRLKAILDDEDLAAKSFPDDEPNPIAQAVKVVDVDSFDASSAVSQIKKQRKKADKAFRQGDSELGKAHKAVADALEEQIDRHIGQSGTPEMADFRKAREIIAKSYDVQKALKGNDVDARVLAAQLKKNPRMSGELRTVAEFGDRFRGASEANPKNSYTDVSIFDAALGVGSIPSDVNAMARVIASGGVAAMRPTIRSVLTSRPYQNLMTQPSRGQGASFRRLSEGLTSDEALSAGSAMQSQQQRKR